MIYPLFTSRNAIKHLLFTFLLFLQVKVLGLCFRGIDTSVEVKGVKW
jgi:hypothetical protein